MKALRVHSMAAVRDGDGFLVTFREGTRRVQVTMNGTDAESLAVTLWNLAKGRSLSSCPEGIEA